MTGRTDVRQNTNSLPTGRPDLSAVVAQRLAPLVALIGRGRAKQVRAEVNGDDQYFWYYWRHIGWIAVMGVLILLAIPFGVLGASSGKGVLTAIGLSLFEAAIGSALLSALYGARWSAYQQRPHLARSFPALFKPRSAEVVIVFALWVVLQVFQFLPTI